MTTIYQPTTTIAVPDPTYPWMPYTPTGSISKTAETKENEEKIIIIDDIKDIEEILVTKKNNAHIKYLATIGITPTPAFSEDVVQKLFLSILLSAVSSVWIPNSLLLSIFFILNIANFFTSLIWDTSVGYKEKLSQIVANFLFVGIATLTELLIGRHQIFFTPITVSVLAIALFFGNISFVVVLSRRITPFIALTRSRGLYIFFRACKKGYEGFSSSFGEELTEEALPKQKHRKGSN